MLAAAQVRSTNTWYGLLQLVEHLFARSFLCTSLKELFDVLSEIIINLIMAGYGLLLAGGDGV